jgi:hypothetical protein
VLEALVWLVAIVGIVLAFRQIGAQRPRVGSASAGTVYDWLNEDKRKALEIVVEGRAEQRDLEHPDDTVPDDDGPPGGRPQR